jgi:hypothetical protein
MDSWEYDHAKVPVDMAGRLLHGKNIFTDTPPDWFNNFVVAGMRNSAKFAALSLFLVGIVWTGFQLIWGSASGMSSATQLLPLMVAGFLLAVYADQICVKMVNLCNGLNSQLHEISLIDFTGEALTLPPQPATDTPGVIAVPQGFVEGVITTLLYSLIVLILELKMVYRMGMLTIGDVVMPIAGVLWAFKITRGWGLRLFALFFGWLFGQPLVVICLALTTSLIGFLNLTDSGGAVLIKVAILVAAIKTVGFFASVLGGGDLFGLAGLMLLFRQTQGLLRRGSANAAGATGTGGSAAQQGAPAVQGGQAGGTGAGSAATGRAWRPAYGTP